MARKPPIARTRPPKPMTATPKIIPTIWSSQMMKQLVGENGMTTMHEDRSLDEQVGQYLHRLRHSLPFPCDPVEVYFSSLPGFIREWHDKGFLTDPLKADVATRNVINMLMRVRAGPKLQLDATMTKVMLRLLDDTEQRLQLFWVVLPFEAPIISMYNHEIDYPPTGVHGNAIRSWHHNASRLDAEIDELMKYTQELAPYVESPAALAAVFPELLNFVRFRNQHLPQRADREWLVRKQFATKRFIDRRERERLLTLLSASTLLPEKELTGWVGHFV